MIIIDKLSYSSGLADVSPEEKFAYAVLTLLVWVVSRSVTAAVIVLAVNGILNVKKGRVPFHLYLKYLMVPLIFLLLSTLAILVNVSKEPLDAYAIPVGQYYVTSSWMGLKKGGQMILTALASVSSLYVLSFNTPMTEILDVLKRLHFPGLFIELMLLTYRFIFILMEGASAIMTAQKARLGNRDLKTSIQSFGQMASVVFVRALKQSDALYNAMEPRCYDGEIRVLSGEYQKNKSNFRKIAVFEAVLILLAVWGRIV